MSQTFTLIENNHDNHHLALVQNAGVDWDAQPLALSPAQLATLWTPDVIRVLEGRQLPSAQAGIPLHQRCLLTIQIDAAYDAAMDEYSNALALAHAQDRVRAAEIEAEHGWSPLKSGGKKAAAAGGGTLGLQMFGLWMAGKTISTAVLMSAPFFAPLVGVTLVVGCVGYCEREQEVECLVLNEGSVRRRAWLRTVQQAERKRIERARNRINAKIASLDSNTPKAESKEVIPIDNAERDRLQRLLNNL